MFFTSITISEWMASQYVSPVFYELHVATNSWRSAWKSQKYLKFNLSVLIFCCCIKTVAKAMMTYNILEFYALTEWFFCSAWCGL